ncbi:MAG: DMT family transporter [Alphaproteobacteria bacterium]|nr:DMT family transporter [Alphaproteobacteria bacterium]
MIDQAKPASALTGYAWGLFAISIWVAWMVATRAGAKSDLDAYDLTALRFAPAALIMLPVAWRHGINPARIGWGVWAILVCGAGVIYSVASATGFRYAPISHGSVLLPGTMPLFTAILSVLILGERIAGPRKLGFALVPVGVVTLVFAGAHDGATGQEWIGQSIFVAVATLWAAYTVTIRKTGIAPHIAIAYVCVWSAILFLPPYAVHVLTAQSPGLLRASWGEWAVQALFQGVLSSVVSLYAYNRAIAILGSSRAAALASLVPVLASLSAIPILGEWPTSTDWLGLAAITAGVYLATGAALPAFLMRRGSG